MTKSVIENLSRSKIERLGVGADLCVCTGLRRPAAPAQTYRSAPTLILYLLSLIGRALPALAIMIVLSGVVQAQLLKKSDYGVGVTVAVYQFDDTRSKKFDEVNKLNQTASTPEEEMDAIRRSFGAEDVKFRYVRSVGLREGESFTDSQPLNERQFSFTMVPRVITKSDVSFEFIAKYDDKVLLEAKGVTVGNYETVMLRGARSGFGVREFQGPNGIEKAPETRALLITITPTVTTTRNLQNKPSDISRPTDQFGSKVELAEGDIFVMPAVTNRVPIKFPPGAAVKGTITLEAVVTPEGRVTNVRVLDTPDPALNPKAIEAFRQYRFNPPKLNGRGTYATFRETIILGKQEPL
jgi:TonB family protein